MRRDDRKGEHLELSPAMVSKKKPDNAMLCCRSNSDNGAEYSILCRAHIAWRR